MPVNISTQIIHASYASVIREIDANANIYDNPNQQGTEYPAWFIVHRSPVEIQRDLGKRLNGNCYVLTYQIDIWYMIQQNITRLFDQYTQIAEQLELKLEYLPIFGSDAVVHVYDKSWSLELNALKYSTTLRLRVFVDKDFHLEPMEVIEDLSVFLKNQKVEFCTLSFTNDEHPAFSVDLPDDIIASIDSFVKLPSVSGEHEKDGELWVPNEWDIGAFGQPVKMANDITANLLWAIKPQYTVSFENTDHPQFDTANRIWIAVEDVQDYIWAYFTDSGAAATGNTSITSGNNYLLYDASGNAIPYDSTKSYDTLEVQYHTSNGYLNRGCTRFDTYADNGSGQLQCTARFINTQNGAKRIKIWVKPIS